MTAWRQTPGRAAIGQTPVGNYRFLDDMGWGDPGCYNAQSKTPTPNLDRLAGQGMRFTDAHSPSGVCTPTRYGLLTGRYAWRTSLKSGVLQGYDPLLVEPGRMTIASLLKQNGYNTGAVGKWHLGHLPQYLPNRRGFDQYFGIPYSNDMNPRVLLRQSGDKTETVEETATLATLTPRYTQEAVNFINASKDAPFFLYMPHTYPHIPLDASEKFRGKSPFGIYGDVLAELDWSVGEVLNAVELANITEALRGPGQTHDLQDLLEAGAIFCNRHPKAMKLCRDRAAPHPKLQTAAGQQISHGHVFGEA